MSKFLGTIRVVKFSVRLETQSEKYILIPYPQQTAFSMKAMEQVGVDLFGYLDNQEVTIDGSLSGNIIYNARLAESDLPIQDVRLAPESNDRFSSDIQQHFRKDKSQIAAKLNDIGIRTISALYHRIKNNYEEEVRAFSKYLKVSETYIKSFIADLESNSINSSLIRASPRFPVKRGVNLKIIEETKGVPVTKKVSTAPPKLPSSAITPNLPSKVDLTVHLTPIKNQGMRGTCVAHTTAACLEAELIKKGKTKQNIDLSEQYLYWACKKIDGSPKSEGTFIQYAVEVLLNGVPKEKLGGGTCTEKEWAYNSLPVSGNEAQGPLPNAVKNMFKGNKQHRTINYTQIKHDSIKAIKTALASGHCVGLSVYTYHFWTDDFAWREAVISLPVGIEPDGAHAICLVGYRDNDASHSDGYFIFKNSWDKTWGWGRPDPGYGSLPYRYILKESIEAYTLDV